MHDTTDNTDSSFEYQVYAVYVHPNYVNNNPFNTDYLALWNDIAILELEDRIPDNPAVATLATTNPAAGDSAHTIGWGLNENGVAQNMLQYIAGNIAVEYSGQHPSHIEFDGDGNTAVCSGDSGTSLYDDEDVLVGVTSYGYADNNNECDSTRNSGFASVAYSLEFICTNTWNEAVTTEGECNYDLSYISRTPIFLLGASPHPPPPPPPMLPVPPTPPPSPSMPPVPPYDPPFPPSPAGPPATPSSSTDYTLYYIIAAVAVAAVLLVGGFIICYLRTK